MSGPGYQERKGDDLVQQAEKKMKGWGFFPGKYDEAAELLEKAATAYKVAKAWEKAANVYQRLSDLQLQKLDSQHEAASNLVEAGNMFKKLSQQAEFTRCLEKAVDLYIDLGRLAMAARQCKDIAERFEREEDHKNACVWFEKAADFYQSENQPSSVNQMRLKLAEHSAIEGNYSKSIEVFETVAQESMYSNLLKFGVKGHLLNAGICQLCRNDQVAIQNAIEKYQNIDSTFHDSREWRLLTSVAHAMEEGDVDAFTEAIAEYDTMSRLDPWKTTLLLRAKNAMKDAEESLT